MLRKILTVSFSFLMLTGCSGLFEKDVVKIAPVPEFDNKIEVHELWSKSVGSLPRQLTPNTYLLRTAAATSTP